jgi:hypothetical protein
MSEKKLSVDQRVDLLEARVDVISVGLNSILAEMARLDNAAEEQKESPVDLEKIKWTEAEGPKGKFDKSEDANNSEFKKLVKTLAEHDKKMTIGSYFVWLFENGSTIGRKKRK